MIGLSSDVLFLFIFIMNDADMFVIDELKMHGLELVSKGSEISEPTEEQLEKLKSILKKGSICDESAFYAMIDRFLFIKGGIILYDIPQEKKLRAYAQCIKF